MGRRYRPVQRLLRADVAGYDREPCKAAVRAFLDRDLRRGESPPAGCGSYYRSKLMPGFVPRPAEET
jgi:hypothetical protein